MISEISEFLHQIPINSFSKWSDKLQAGWLCYVACTVITAPSSVKNEWAAKWKKFIEVSSARTLSQGREELRQKFNILPEDEESYSLELKIPKKRPKRRSSSPEEKHRKNKAKVCRFVTIFF